MRKKSVLTILLLFLLFVGFGLVAHAQTAGQNDKIVNVDFPCPGCQNTTDDIVTYVNNFYKFSLWIGGALALGIIVAGGIMRIVSAGSPDKQREASEMVTSSIFGLLLLFGSYLVLNTINPEITLLKLPAAGEEEKKLTSENTDSLTSSDCVGSGVQSFETIRVFDGKDQRSDLNCVYRRSVTPTAIGIIEGNYYNDDPAIPASSMVWLYPYFRKTDGASKAECLIYAFLSPEKDAEIEPVELNADLQLCAPKFQSLDSPICKVWEFRAKNADSGLPVLLSIYVSTSTTSAFNYPNPNNQPPLESVPGRATVLGDLLTGTKYYCVGSDGKADKNNICEQDGKEPFWRCRDFENPKIDTSSNNVKVEACAASSSAEPCVGISDLGFPGSDSCDKTINNTKLNADRTCKINPDLAKKLRNFKDKMAEAGINWYITEAWPPKSAHQDSCHKNGTCVDIGLGNADCGSVQKTLNFLKSGEVGLRPVNEWLACPNTTPKPQKTSFATGNHIHVEL